MTLNNAADPSYLDQIVARGLDHAVKFPAAAACFSVFCGTAVICGKITAFPLLISTITITDIISESIKFLPLLLISAAILVTVTYNKFIFLSKIGIFIGTKIYNHIYIYIFLYISVMLTALLMPRNISFNIILSNVILLLITSILVLQGAVENFKRRLLMFSSVVFVYFVGVFIFSSSMIDSYIRLDEATLRIESDLICIEEKCSSGIILASFTEVSVIRFVGTSRLSFVKTASIKRVDKLIPLDREGLYLRIYRYFSRDWTRNH